MILNLNDLMDANRAPWKLELQLDGKTYTVRELSQVELDALARSSDGPESLAKVVVEFFAGEKPTLATLTTDRVVAITAAIANYIIQRQRQLTDRIGKKVRALALAEHKE